MPRLRIFCNVDLSLKPDALKVLEKVADIDYFEARRDILLDNIADYDIYFASANVQADAEVIGKAKKLKIIATPSTGTDHIDRDFAFSMGIKIMDISNDYDILDTFSATAEMAWALLLACVRNLPLALEDAKQGVWSRQKLAGRQLLGKTLGILGYGRLGKMIAEMGRAFRMKVIACDLKKIEAETVEQVDFNYLLKHSDILSINIHLNEKNKGIISRLSFEKMKRGIVIINTSRGAVIDEEALLDALNSGKVAAAGLDVINGEWDDNLAQHPLIKYAREHNNLLITPHIGGSTFESITGAQQFMARKLVNYLKEEMI